MYFSPCHAGCSSLNHTYSLRGRQVRRPHVLHFLCHGIDIYELVLWRHIVSFRTWYYTEVLKPSCTNVFDYVLFWCKEKVNFYKRSQKKMWIYSISYSWLWICLYWCVYAFIGVLWLQLCGREYIMGRTRFCWRRKVCVVLQSHANLPHLPLRHHLLHFPLQHPCTYCHTQVWPLHLHYGSKVWDQKILLLFSKI